MSSPQSEHRSTDDTSAHRSAETQAAPPAGHGHSAGHASQSSLLGLVLTALGVVYGDIGTSPLYALRESFHSHYGLELTPENILGILSLVFWALVLVITIKYVIFILRADNGGEGGILALTALATPIRPLTPDRRLWIVLLGVFGAALLYGDGIITPAISVLSAVEGLTIATPIFEPYIIPLTLIILVGLFLIQSRGTARIGRLFGPIMLFWFVVLGVLGIINIIKSPEVLAAVNPFYALSFFRANGLSGYLVLGSVFLSVTGGEALYADMGHVGRMPIRLAWVVLVLPALLLNYFGQGALLLHSPEAIENSFYLMAPSWALVPLVILSTIATIIASQALITGVFSITMQGENLGFLPRLRTVHTSATAFGQIYIPQVNWVLMAACLFIVIAFRTSSNLAAAYGIAVTTTMAITTLIFAVAAREKWGWSWLHVVFIVLPLMVIDLAFLGANINKIPHGGWFPLVIAAFLFLLMTTWKRGSMLVFEQEKHFEMQLEQLFEQMRTQPPMRASGVAIFLSANATGVPSALLANLQHNDVIHEYVLLTTVSISERPHVPAKQRLSVQPLEHGFYHITIRFGFMEEPIVPAELATLVIPGVPFDPETVPYYVNRTRVIPTDLPGMALWREQLYTIMRHNATSAVDFFGLPPARIFEIGTSIEV